jgi:hypothetical protein
MGLFIGYHFMGFFLFWLKSWAFSFRVTSWAFFILCHFMDSLCLFPLFSSPGQRANRGTVIPLRPQHPP